MMYILFYIFQEVTVNPAESILFWWLLFVRYRLIGLELCDWRKVKSLIAHQTSEQYEAEYRNASRVTAIKHNTTNHPYSRSTLLPDNQFLQTLVADSSSSVKILYFLIWLKS